MRRRYRFDEAAGVMVEVGLVREVPRARVHIQTGAHYDGLRATDGTPVDTAKRHRQYMKDHNLALYEDYKETFAKSTEERERERMNLGPRDETLKEDIHEAYNMVRDGYKPVRAEGIDPDDEATVSSYIVGKDV